MMRKGQQDLQATARMTPETEGLHGPTMVSLAALLAFLAAGFVLALGQAEPSPALTNLISTLLH